MKAQLKKLITWIVAAPFVGVIAIGAMVLYLALTAYDRLYEFLDRFLTEEAIFTICVFICFAVGVGVLWGSLSLVQLVLP